MPVDRDQRDAVADSLAAFLRGEIGRKVWRTRLDPICTVLRNTTVRDGYLHDFLLEWEWPWLSDPLSKEDWEQLRRHLAFLKTDLEERKFSLPSSLDDDADRPRQIRLARWHVLGLAVPFGLSFVVGWWLFVVALVISFILYQVSMWRHGAAWDKAFSAESSRVLAFYPFASEEEWSAHEGRLEPYRLPGYDPQIHCQRERRTLAARIGNALRMSASFILFATIFGIMIPVASLLMWPLWLVLMSLCKR
jgi:hypothetical protein